jgi:hypothetical protein
VAYFKSPMQSQLLGKTFWPKAKGQNWCTHTVTENIAVELLNFIWKNLLNIESIFTQNNNCEFETLYLYKFAHINLIE